MKHIATLITILLFSQMMHSQKSSEPYKTIWKKVENLENESLTKSALEVVRTISEKAKMEKNAAQIVKALLYSSKYAMILEEDAQLNIVNDFKSEIKKAAFPTKNVLESYLARMYWQYFQQNRYQFYNRTKTETKVDSTDFRTWDLTTLFHEIDLHFERSLQNEAQLKATLVHDFEPILHKQEKSEEYRPTLFDLLAHAALDFYKSGENNVTRPADRFEIDDPELLCEARFFPDRTIDTTDRTSLQAKALRVYQKLVMLHLPSQKPYTLAEVDIERLRFIYQNAVFENKDEQYIEVLNNTVEALNGNLAASLYRYEIAALLQQQGNGYDPKNNVDVRWKHQEALAICNEVINSQPVTRGADKCKALQSQILAKSLQLTTEKYIPIGTQARLLVNYKNHRSLRLTAFRTTPGQIKALEQLYPMPKKLSFIREMMVVEEWETQIKDEQDYQNHSTEISMPGLENGHYIILASPIDGENKSDLNQTFAYSPVQVTNIALIETRTPTHQRYQAVNRDNGQPIAAATIKIRYQRNYDGAFRTKTMTTDTKGFINIPLSEQYWNNVTITVSHHKDTAHFGEFYVNRKYEDSASRTDHIAFLLTDRSIYRPGQPLYFKGIAIKRTHKVSSVLENTMVTVVLKDVNYQELAKQEFRTNRFGSFSGEFILPNNGLTGAFSMEVNSKQLPLNGSTSFSVEEYKRPKFETSFERITETYKVNDSITVKGKATAYAGSNITDAKVAYTVKRVVSFPRWYSWYRPYFSGSPQEIAHGETITDADGGYQIDFKAIPDNNIDKKALPTFTYEISADVTDINGETHSATTTVRIGYHALTAQVYVGNLLDKDGANNQIKITTTNLNGQFVPAKGTLKMYKLKAPEYVLRPRPWAAPDYEGFSRAEFKKLYPHDAYGNEHDPSQWEKGTMVWESDFDTGKATEVALKNIKKWESGKYVIELETQDKFGQEVKDVVRTTLFSQTDNTLADNQLFRIKTDKDSYRIGDNVEVTLLSSSENLTVTVFLEKKRKIIETKVIELNNNSKSFTIPVTKDDEGGFSISYSFSAYNAFQKGSLIIAVPYPVTDLEIETGTFRDKLQPGTEETWTFKVKGPKGEKVTAELLASMYDASLDAFRGHYWSFDPIYRPYYYSNLYIQGHHSYGTNSFNVYTAYGNGHSYQQQYFDSFNWFGFHFGYGRYYGNGLRRMRKTEAPQAVMMDATLTEESLEDTMEGQVAGLSVDNEKAPPPSAANAVVERKEEKDDGATSFDDVQIRKNLQETAFFFPQLQTDQEGNVAFSFTTPEALTQWKLQLLAHTKTLQSAYTNLQTVTQKELMVIPNAPRFLREGDEITISTKIANLTDKRLTGHAKLELIDAVSNNEISSKLLKSTPSGGSADGDGVQDDKTTKSFTVDSLGNTQISWRLQIPKGIQAVQYKIIAKAGDFSDGEQNVLPVLTNRMLVTETLPMWVRSNQTKTFVLDKLKNSASTTLKHHKLTLEMTSNPAWYAVQALPYLMEYPYECNEQIFARYYANSLASHIVNSNPRIQEVFDQWRSADALLSNLEKNQELKSLLIQETPWLRDAQSETEQKKRIALLFNMDKMKQEQTKALRKLQLSQKSNGAWAWFKGGPDSRFITQHIIAGWGHLTKLAVASSGVEHQASGQMIQKAISYLDKEFIKEYEHMKKYASNPEDDHLSQTQVHYLYMRSFFEEINTSKKVDDLIAYYQQQAQKYWMRRGLFSKGMLALVLHRMGDVKTSRKIMRALEESSIISEELGMYWKENTASWYWYRAPIETQSLLIEAFSEIQEDIITIDNLKIWLLKNKQTNQWKTTKATTDAIYALLLQGNDWLSVTDAVEVLIGGEKITPSKLENVQVEAGTGYYKTSWNGSEVRPQMAEVQISKKGDGIAWGGLYWQYFEDLDKITFAKTPLQLKKKLFLKKNTDTGEEITEITSKTQVSVGDLIRVRIELRADRDMEFVHMKDMRAAGFEPVNVLSNYKWQDGLGYYESTKDASTNFFFDFLPKGVYVFEYDVRANNAGDFSNGITTIQSMYAPEFSSHSEGVRVSVNASIKK
ncbi:alpha-2-macroglobulin [Flavobacteriaceae bacterium TP-CH-4]|uniref:Alpha-2-macroglobulin n=1 Tax=Pelagihabitans pacificus TaxID=2696054 RepID=A0A967AQ27_9FLAO|nr:MG2 domain-containing protein [Pelagihabitans pacificus]NHF58268.1 alpha-2-macroglobulin [Pelagihabitans pacificus]